MTPTEQDRYVKVASAETPVELDAFVNALRDANIAVMSVARGQQVWEPATTTVPHPWWEVRVRDRDVERAAQLIDQTSADLKTGTDDEEDEVIPDDLRPQAVRLAGLFHLSLGFWGIALLGAEHVIGGLVPNPALWLSCAVVDFLVGYGLVWGPDRGRTWRRIRLVALVRVGVALFVATGVVSGLGAKGIPYLVMPVCMAIALALRLTRTNRFLLRVTFFAAMAAPVVDWLKR